jgi:hypothetical protein
MRTLGSEPKLPDSERFIRIQFEALENRDFFLDFEDRGAFHSRFGFLRVA